MAGYIAGQHMVKLGMQNLAFVARTHSAPTIEARVAGAREAMLAIVWYRQRTFTGLVIQGIPALSNSCSEIERLTGSSALTITQRRC